MCYCTPSIRTPCCGEKCHDFLGPEAAPCPWHQPFREDKLPSVQDWASRAASRIDDEYPGNSRARPSEARIAAIIATFAAPILKLLAESRREHDGKCKVFETATEDAEGTLELDNADCTCGTSAWNARIDQVLR